MPAGLKEDLKQLKKFKEDYKKCRVVDVKEAKKAEVYAKRIKYFKYDLSCGLDALGEVVGEMKCEAEPIKSTKIKDYAVNKDARALLKASEWNRDKLLDAYTKLDKLEKNADITACTKKLNFLLKAIILDTKIRKGGKPEPMVAKMQKQIEADLKVMNNYYTAIKKFLPNHPKLLDPAKEYDKSIREIVNAKPRLSAKTKKFNGLFKDMLEKPKLQKNIKQCADAQKVMYKNVKVAQTLAAKGDSKGGIPSWQAGQVELKKIQAIANSYIHIQKKYAAEIKKTPDPAKKLIKTSIKKILKFEEDSTKHSEQVMDKINKANKANQAK